MPPRECLWVYVPMLKRGEYVWIDNPESGQLNSIFSKKLEAMHDALRAGRELVRLFNSGGSLKDTMDELKDALQRFDATNGEYL